MSLKDCRLKREKDFDLVFKKGKRLFSGSLSLIYLPSESLKAGFAVGKKHGDSVTRNRIKRILRESFRSFMPEIGQNFFFVFIPKISGEYSYFTFREDMKKMLMRGGFIKRDA